MNYYYPWGPPPPPQNNRGGLSNRDINKIVKNAIREAMRLRDHDKNVKNKKKEERSKAKAKTRAAMMTFIEIFALGVICQPLVLLVFEILKHKVQ